MSVTSFTPCVLYDSGAMTDAAALGADTDTVGFTDRAARGDCILFMHPDDPPACSPPWIDAVNALAALQHALAKVVAMQGSTELQLAVYAGQGRQYVRHRDALPDGGTEHDQRRV